MHLLSLVTVEAKRKIDESTLNENGQKIRTSWNLDNRTKILDFLFPVLCPQFVKTLGKRYCKIPQKWLLQGLIYFSKHCRSKQFSVIQFGVSYRMSGEPSPTSYSSPFVHWAESRLYLPSFTCRISLTIVVLEVEVTIRKFWAKSGGNFWLFIVPDSVKWSPNTTTLICTFWHFFSLPVSQSCLKSRVLLLVTVGNKWFFST